MSAAENLLGALLDAEGMKSNAQALLDAAGVAAAAIDDARVRVAWTVVERMTKSRRPVDAYTVWQAGVASKTFGESDLGWLQALQTQNTLTPAIFADAAGSFRRQQDATALQRALAEALQTLSKTGDAAQVAGSLLSTCEGITTRDDSTSTGDADVLELAAQWESRSKAGRPLILATGLPKLDEQIGGWMPNLNVVAGLPSTGKSAFMATCIERQLAMGVKVGLVGLEDGTLWVAKRLVARDLAMRVRDVGNVKIESIDGERYATTMAATSERLRNLLTYKRTTIRTEDLVRLCSGWIQNQGVGCIYVDHGGEVDHARKEGDEFRLAVANTYKRLRDLAARTQVPLVVLVHTTRPDKRGNDDEERPPKASEMAESAYIERMARLILGVWGRPSVEEDATRITVVKHTEGKRGLTLRMLRHTEAALLDAETGELVNLGAERAIENRAKREASEKDRERTRAKREAERDAKAEEKAKAKEAAKTEAQGVKTKAKQAKLELMTPEPTP